LLYIQKTPTGSDVVNSPVNLYSVSDGTFCYGALPVFESLNFSLDKECFYGLIGPNGSGKSTLIDILSGIHPLDKGEIEFRGFPLSIYKKRELARLIALVPQSISLGFDFTVHDIVLMGRNPYINRLSRPTAMDFELVDSALSLLDISHLRKRSVVKLSGGEKQRVIVARAIAQNTDTLILDEATANLDIAHTLKIMQVLAKKVRNTQKTVIAAIHDLNLAAAYCDKLIVLQEGKIRKIGATREVLTAQLIRDVFSVNCTVIKEEERMKVDFEMTTP